MSIITLTTDFGTSANDVGVLSGVIWRIAPETCIVDLTHEIPPQDIIAAQVVLHNTTSYFPNGSIHMVVVDPGVGTARRPIAAQLGEQFFVGPDNGLLTPLLEKAEADGKPVEIVHLTKPQFWLPSVSHIFHGRDIFAPVAAHLARGVPPSAMGERITNPIRSGIPEPEPVEGGWCGRVAWIDHFGNLLVNISAKHLENVPAIEIFTKGQTIQGLSQTFGDGKPGDLIALMDSSNWLNICVVNGSAAERLNAQPGDRVEVHCHSHQGSTSTR